MKPKRDLSDKLWQEALRHIPGGVNSPVRAFRGVGGTPFFTQRAKGSRLWDVDGNEYIDYVCSWGPMILGHAHPKVVRAVQEAARDGTSFGTPNPREIRLAQLVCEAFPSIQKVRFVSSGTEATMSAIRLARGFTKRDKILKFEGCYHGHADALLVKAGSGAATFDVPDSAGVPADFARNTLTLPLNDLAAIDRVNWSEIACAIIEPIPANMGLIPLRIEFLKKLRQVTTAPCSFSMKSSAGSVWRRAAPRNFTASKPTSPPSEKSSAAACLRAHSEDGPTLWTCSRPTVPFIKPVRCRATRWPWLPESRRWRNCSDFPG